MPARALHQLTAGAAVGDAITDHALLLRRWLRALGLRSEIYAGSVAPELAAEIRPAALYRPGPGEAHVIYHHSIGTPVAERLAGLPARLILVYHNITPPEYFSEVDPVLAAQMSLGRQQLELLRPRTALAVGVSAYNAAELRAAGFENTMVLPLPLDAAQYEAAPDAAVRERWGGEGGRLLFVGRLLPSKKQEDLIKLLHYYRRIDPAARLLLVGEPWLPAYATWLRDLAADLGLAGAVCLAGRASQADLVNYYRLADLYVSMSEHEGVGKPLVESMYLGLPVLAYAAAGVPGTLGGAGVLFHHKHFEALAEVVDWLVRDPSARARMVARGRARAQHFLADRVQRQWQAALAGLGVTSG